LLPSFPLSFLPFINTTSVADHLLFLCPLWLDRHIHYSPLYKQTLSPGWGIQNQQIRTPAWIEMVSKKADRERATGKQMSLRNCHDGRNGISIQFCQRFHNRNRLIRSDIKLLKLRKETAKDRARRGLVVGGFLQLDKPTNHLYWWNESYPLYWW